MLLTTSTLSAPPLAGSAAMEDGETRQLNGSQAAGNVCLSKNRKVSGAAAKGSSSRKWLPASRRAQDGIQRSVGTNERFVWQLKRRFSVSPVVLTSVAAAGY